MPRQQQRSRRRAAERAQHALAEAVRADVARVRGVAGRGRAAGGRIASAGPGERRIGLLPLALIVLGSAMVLAAGAIALGGISFAFTAKELEARPGKAVAIPFERIHAAQRKRIRAAMSAPFVLGVPRKLLDRIAECESHGDPRAIGGGGLYRGKYQFHRSTWAGVGGSGDPARASELEQDRRAAMLIKQSGTGHWPICG